MNDDQLLRYSRHILLDEIGIEGQQRLLAAHALVIGAGGLGSPVALYLGTAGVGRLTIVDHDTVDVTNLQRQIAHNLARVGTAQGRVGARHDRRDQSRRAVTPLVERADAARLDALVQTADVVVDCSDNFATRHAVNAACVAHRKPLVSGAAIGFDGQVSVYDTRDAEAPCYACLFPRRGHLRGGAMRDHGRLRAAGRHHRLGAGGRGAQAVGRHRHIARRPAADARRANDGVDRNPHAAQRRLRRVLEALTQARKVASSASLTSMPSASALRRKASRRAPGRRTPSSFSISATSTSTRSR